MSTGLGSPSSRQASKSRTSKDDPMLSPKLRKTGDEPTRKYSLGSNVSDHSKASDMRSRTNSKEHEKHRHSKEKKSPTDVENVPTLRQNSASWLRSRAVETISDGNHELGAQTAQGHLQ